MNAIACPICKNIHGNTLVEDRTNVPTLQNVTLATNEDALGFPTGSLKLYRCPKCTFVWNSEFNANAIVYDAHYNNDVSNSAYYLAHLDAMADQVIAATNPEQPFSYVEVGCGDASFLRLVVKKAGGRCVSAIGFDPSFADESKLPANVQVFKTFFGPNQKSHLPGKVDVVCSRHTIEHVPDAHTFMSALAEPVKTTGTRLLIETPDADWILRNLAFQDVFYEHCSLFTTRSILHLLDAHGLQGVVTPVYGSQYMWVDASRPAIHQKNNQLFPMEGDQSSLAERYALQRQELIDHWLEYLKKRQAFGGIAIWGAASKGVTFNLLIAGRSDVQIACAIDLNVAKQGRFLPATGLPVVTPEDAKKRGVQSVIIMNPNYEHEIRAMASKMNWNPEFVSLNSSPLAVSM